MALLFEIFWHDCLRHLNEERIREFMMPKKKEGKMKVRRIQVKPMERIDDCINKDDVDACPQKK